MLSILTNEKYKGDALLQKTFCTDFLTKKMKVNEGEVPQYYVENSHPAIIAPEVFDAVQAELKRRRQPGRRNTTPHCFSGRIYCDECGAVYGSKVWNSNSKYRARVWQCNEKHRGHTVCKTPALRDETIQDAFVQAFNQVIGRKEEIIEACEAVMRERCDTAPLDEKITALQTEMEVVAELMRRCILTNAQVAQDQAEYQRQYGEYEARYEQAKAGIAEAEARREAMAAKRGQLALYMESLREKGLIRAFDETLWYGTVEQVRVKADGRMRFIFKGGQEIEV